MSISDYWLRWKWTKTKDKIYKNRILVKKGANRYRYFTTLYSMMSEFVHGKDVLWKKDVVMIHRATEDASLRLIS